MMETITPFLTIRAAGIALLVTVIVFMVGAFAAAYSANGRSLLPHGKN